MNNKHKLNIFKFRIMESYRDYIQGDIYYLINERVVPECLVLSFEKKKDMDILCKFLGEILHHKNRGRYEIESIEISGRYCVVGGFTQWCVVELVLTDIEG